MKTLWKLSDEARLEELKAEILTGSTLARPDPTRRFCLKTDWSKSKMGAVLLQADPADEQATNAEARELAGGKCEFDKTKSGLRLRPIAFLDRTNTPGEHSYHSFTGEAAAGRWAIGKFKKYLYGVEFTWLTDCSGLRQFFESDDSYGHVTQRWRAELLRFQFSIEHRPGRMLTECDALSRYNTETKKWRAGPDSDDNEPPIATANVVSAVPPPRKLFDLSRTPENSLYQLPPMAFHSTAPTPSTEPRQQWDPDRVVFTVGAYGTPLAEAILATTPSCTGSSKPKSAQRLATLPSWTTAATAHSLWKNGLRNWQSYQ